MKSNWRGLAPGLIICVLLAMSAAPVGADTTGDPPRDELVTSALRHSPEYTRPVVNPDGSPVAVFYDLNGDDSTDIAFLTVLAEPDVPVELHVLRDTARLFRSVGPVPLFVLETYFAGGESVQTVELGRRPALGGIELLPLSEEALPVAIAVKTRGAAGGETNLLVYSPGGLIRRLELRETERERYQFADLDRDGVIDIVVTRKLPEAGRGYETFVELWALSGNRYTSGESFGLVRELQLFLGTAVDHMVNGRWAALVPMVEPDGHDPTTILTRAFTGIADDEELDASVFDYPESGAPVSAVVFPGIRENPIPYPYLGASFTLVFRVECCETSPRFYSATVGLLGDPFHEQRFLFLTHADAQQ